MDSYFAEKLLGADEGLAAVAAASDAAGLPQIAVSPLQGRFLQLLAGSIRARNVLEIGTLGGYSTICLARGVGPEGRVLSLEYEPRHAEVARSSIATAGLSGVVEIRVGRALDLLPRVEADGVGPFDLVFIDADKEGNADYVQWAIRLAHRGTVIVVDNVVRDGGVGDPNSSSPDVLGTWRMVDLLEGNERLGATAIQTVGAKGYDGFLYAVVR
jgi:predicted O-methyltransferase YrrM